MLLAQTFLLDNEKIKLVWHLKKITSDDAADSLFTSDNNSWRRRPTHEETDDALQKRLAAMLNYYSVYFALIAKEASYFAPGRIPLPFFYYQHAIGMNPNLSPAFRQFFYDDVQAHAAFIMLEQAMAAHHSDFPTGTNFGNEYGGYCKVLADALHK